MDELNHLLFEAGWERDNLYKNRWWFFSQGQHESENLCINHVPSQSISYAWVLGLSEDKICIDYELRIITFPKKDLSHLSTKEWIRILGLVTKLKETFHPPWEFFSND